MVEPLRRGWDTSGCRDVDVLTIVNVQITGYNVEEETRGQQRRGD